MAERGVRVDHSTIFRWDQKWSGGCAGSGGVRCRIVGGSPFVTFPLEMRVLRPGRAVDETYIKMRGKTKPLARHWRLLRVLSVDPAIL